MHSDQQSELMHLFEKEGAAHLLEREMPLARHTSIRIGGPADLLVNARSKDELIRWVSLARQAGVPCTVLGGGSNILVSDHGLEGLVIRNLAREIHVPTPMNDTPTTAYGESGMPFALFALRCLDAGLGEFAWAATIPGSLGGAVIGNAGCYGGEVSQFLMSAEVLLEDGSIENWDKDQLGCAYRKTIVKEIISIGQTAPVVLSAEFRLPAGSPEETYAQLGKHKIHRLRTQPRQPNMGSVFKNPPEEKAGKLLAGVDLKGHTIGGAGFSEKHANFILNMDHARAEDVVALVRLARKRVYEVHGVELTPEVLFLGEWDHFPPYT